MITLSKLERAFAGIALLFIGMAIEPSIRSRSIQEILISSAVILVCFFVITMEGE